ncbi:MAG: FAD-dependent oxidoreductase [Ruminococcaceae bacterium]|nr:FAD-dependent oxidoreductase [Oscillospiraceae bacterium]
MNPTPHYDIAVCGGGFAGIAAALSAAREGRRVILFEKEYLLGGLGTAGLVTVYLPLCDGCGHQVSFGIAEELLRLSITYGADAMYPGNWLDSDGPRGIDHHRFMVQYNPHIFAILAEKLLTESGVDILYGSYVVGTAVEDGRITTLYVENKSGRTAYRIRAVVDATGDADIAQFAGAPTAVFGRGNILAGWYYYTDEGGNKLQMLGAADNFQEPPAGTRYTGLDGAEISDMVRASHEMTLRHYLQKKEQNPSASLSTIASIPQLRMTRRIVGEHEMTEGDDHACFADSVGMVGNWKRRGPVYEIPFRALYSKKVKNLITAGRCISTDDTMWDVMRVIPCCAVTGQAAGTAAALSEDFSTLNVKELQAVLQNRGVVLHESEILG